MAGFQAHAVNVVLRIVKARSSATPEALRAELARRSLPSPEPPASARRGVDIAADTMSCMPVYRVTPPGTAPARTIVYLHGGAYLHPAAPPHWALIRRLARTVPATVRVPMYPLAPEATAAATVASVTDVLANLLQEHGAEQVILVGDSAGGGLALAVAQQARDAGQPSARRLILIGPWLDIACDEPAQRSIEPRDHLLRLDTLREAGRLYAGDLPADDVRVSPIHGRLGGLPPIDVFTGTDDVLNVDARRLHELGRACGHPVTLDEAPGMQHVYPIFPFLPEAARARSRIVELCRD